MCLLPLLISVSPQTNAGEWDDAKRKNKKQEKKNNHGGIQSLSPFFFHFFISR